MPVPYTTSDAPVAGQAIEASKISGLDQTMKQTQVKELLLRSLEHARAGITVNETALRCVVNEALEKEWARCLEQTRNHERILIRALSGLSVDPEEESPGRTIVKQLGAALVQAMESAREAANPAAAELVACQCVVLAETRDHAGWDLIRTCADHATGEQREVLTAAADEVGQQDERLYHSKEWLQGALASLTAIAGARADEKRCQ